MRKVITNFVFVLLLFSFSIAPYLALGADPLVPCGTPGGKACTFSDLGTLFNRVMNFLLKDILAPLAVIAIVYTGIQFVVAAGNPGKLDKAKELLWYVLLGIFVALAAWAIIDLIFNILTPSGGLEKHPITG